MFELTVSQRFKASHAVRAMSGELEPLHTHDWKVDITITGRNVDANGCIMDFALLQRHLRACIAMWDGKNLNELSMFLDISPSTEFLARCLFDQLEEVLAEEGVGLKKVAVWETENCSAAYVKDGG